MRVLVIGNGAREHALVWKLKQSPLVEQVFVFPGNAGMSSLAECLDAPTGQLGYEALADVAESHDIGLTVVGPEQYLVDGVVDVFKARGLRIFGPTRAASQLEASKIWAKNLMVRLGIPTAEGKAFHDIDEARDYALKRYDWRCVVKADGLAAGKGSIVCRSKEDVNRALKLLFVEKKHGDMPVVIEELLQGQEVSVFAISDGVTVLPFGAAQDHKRQQDNDKGPNTGGMGAYSPVDHMGVPQRFAESFFQPIIDTLRADGIPYVGFIYAGAIVTPVGPRILEFNVRLGDPEAEVLLPRLDSDLAHMLNAAAEGLLDDVAEPRWKNREALCVVLASEGYPEPKDPFGHPISGLDVATEQGGADDLVIFHAGTEYDPDTHEYLTNGGRVLAVTGLGSSIQDAQNRAYAAADQISFKGKQYRRDIGAKATGFSWDDVFTDTWRGRSNWESVRSDARSEVDEIAKQLERVATSGNPMTRNSIRAAISRLYDLRRRLATVSSGVTDPSAERRVTVREAAEEVQRLVFPGRSTAAVERVAGEVAEIVTDFRGPLDRDQQQDIERRVRNASQPQPQD